MLKRFPRTLVALMALVIALMSLAGCGGEKKSATDAPKPRTITDISGNAVTVPTNVAKIAVTPLPWASVVTALDENSDRIVAMHPGAMPAYKGKFLETKDAHFGSINTTLIGQDFKPNIEGLLNAGVEAVILWPQQTEDAQKLKEVGIAPIMISNRNIEELQNSFLIVGELLGKEDRAKKVNEYYQTTYDDIKKHSAAVEAAAKPKILFLRNQKLRLQGNDHFLREAIAIAGGDNPTDASKSNQEQTITMEEVLAIDPDIILLSNFDPFVPDDLYENKIPGQDWSSVKAVRERRVYKVPLGIYRWDAPGVETPLMMRWLAQLFQPEIFKDTDVRKETVKFMKDFMGYEVSADDLAKIFADEANKNSQGMP